MKQKGVEKMGSKEGEVREGIEPPWRVLQTLA